MGLDGVEMVMALEEAFGIELKVEEIEKTVTPRLIGDVIFSKLQSTDQKICQSQRAFYLLRKFFMRKFGLQRADITPDMLFRALIPANQESAIWNDLKISLHARSWPVGRPRWLVWVLGVATLACGVITTALSISWSDNPTISILFGIIAIAIFGISAAKTTRRFKTRIPFWIRRIRDIVPYAVTSDEIKWTREQVSAVVKQVVQEQLGISDEKYWEDAHFVNDFGMDQ